jgi:hypothetical protein
MAALSLECLAFEGMQIAKDFVTREVLPAVADDHHGDDDADYHGEAGVPRIAS